MKRKFQIKAKRQKQHFIGGFYYVLWPKQLLSMDYSDSHASYEQLQHLWMRQQ